MANIHSTAVISDNVHVAEDVSIGPYVVIEDDVHIGAGSVIGSHSVIHSYVEIGKNNHIHEHVVLGGVPQDISFHGKETWLKNW